MTATHLTSAEHDPPSVAAALKRAGFAVGRPLAVRRSALDTFDGRLHRAGLSLELREARGARRLILRAKGTPDASTTVDAAPRLAGDLPPGPLRARLAPVLDVRALLPVATLAGRETAATRRGPAGKTLVSVVLHDRLALEGTDVAMAPAWAAELVGLTGYPDAAADASRLLSSLGLRQEPGDLLGAAMTAAGVDPRGVGGSPTIALDRSQPALGAYRAVLAHLAGAVEANWQGTVDDVDSEFLHDLRVAVRRSRSVLAQAKRVLPPAVRDRYRDELSWLGGATGPARDLDVWVLEWDTYVAPLDAGTRPDLDPVLAHVTARRTEAHTALAKVLRSARYRRLMKSWTAWLAGPEGEGGPDAARPIGKVAAQRMARAQDAVVANGRAIGPDSVPEELHELRKDAKKLRYLLECFGGVLDPGPRKAFVQQLKALQDNLGEFQDASVHLDQLAGVAGDLHGTATPAATLLAVGRLTGHMEERQRAAREEFAGRFAAYDTKANARALRALLDSASRR